MTRDLVMGTLLSMKLYHVNGLQIIECVKMTICYFFKET